MIEHRFPGGAFFTTLYGHLGSKRLVKMGDVVKAGQQVGTIGAKSPYVNGGYTPHVHLGVRDGRLAEPGCTLLFLDGASTKPLKLLAVGEDEIELQMPPGAAVRLFDIGGHRYTVTARRPLLAPAKMLWEIANRPGFTLVGYALTTEGWRDPVDFLRQNGADRAGAGSGR